MLVFVILLQKYPLNCDYFYHNVSLQGEINN